MSFIKIYLCSVILLLGHQAYAIELSQEQKMFIFSEQQLMTLESGDPDVFADPTNFQDEEFKPENGNLLLLKSYWVDEVNFGAFQVENLPPELKETFFRRKNGKLQYRILVHPESEYHYSQILQNAEQGDSFEALATASSRSLVVQREGHPRDPVFIAKVSLDSVIGEVRRNIKSNEVARSIGTSKVLIFLKRLFSEKINFMPEVIGLHPKADINAGMIIRILPKSLNENHTSFIPAFALYGKPPHPYKKPILAHMIKNSGLKGSDYIRQNLIGPFIKQWLTLTLNGVSIEAHGQNFLVGINLPDTTDSNLSEFEILRESTLNHEYMFRDFGGFNLDLELIEKVHGKEAVQQLPYVNSVNKDYFSKYHDMSLQESLDVYFHSGFIFDIEKSLRLWSKNKWIPTERIYRNQLKDILIEEFNYQYKNLTGLNLKLSPAMKNIPRLIKLGKENVNFCQQSLIAN